MGLIDAIQVAHRSWLCELAIGDVSVESLYYFFDSPQTLEFAGSSGTSLLAS
jgi:hypothetical protein